MSTPKVRRQYGVWDSPITPRSMSRGITLADLALTPQGELAWLERRADRSVLVLQGADEQAPRDLSSELSVKARLGYGGGDFCLGAGNAYVVEAESGRIFAQPLRAGSPRPLTPAFGRCASPALSPDGRWLVYVHSYEGRDCLAIVDAQGKGWPQQVAAGADFYMQPAWSPDGRSLAWVEWNHPNMPWDGTWIRLGEFSAPPGGPPQLAGARALAGGDEISAFQPQFSPDGRYLAYVSDESGWWQIYLHDLASGEVARLTDAPAEHAQPAWVQGMRAYQFGLDGTRVIFLRNQKGRVSLWQVDLATRREEQLRVPEAYANLEQIAIGLTPGGQAEGIGLLASGGQTPPRLITLQSSGGERIWRRATSEELPAEAYSQPAPLAWPGMDGETAYGLYFPPHNPRFEGVGKPPLLVNIHGGPTSQVRQGFNLRAQFFATRGYAVLEVNYRGSTGYGREYRNQLRGNWGIYDVQDAVSGARSLAEQGRVDGDKVVIMGGSAGGFTVLKALEDFPGFFKAGVCLYGISNQFTAAVETHKFEERYSDSLLGALPEAAQVYRERSPLFFADKIQDPIAIFQGEDDQVVCRNQSDEMVAALARRGVPHLYQVYPGEGHGFQKPETIEHFYRTLEGFLKQHVLYA